MNNRITEREIALIAFVVYGFLPLFPEKPNDNEDHNHVHRAVDFINKHEDLLDSLRKFQSEIK